MATFINDLPAAQTVVAFSKVSWVDIAVLFYIAAPTNTHIRGTVGRIGRSWSFYYTRKSMYDMFE